MSRADYIPTPRLLREILDVRMAFLKDASNPPIPNRLTLTQAQWNVLNVWWRSGQLGLLKPIEDISQIFGLKFIIDNTATAMSVSFVKEPDASGH